MRPENTSVVIRPDLSVIATEYLEGKAAARFIGRKAAPTFKVATSTGQYPVINREFFKKRTESKKAPQGGYNRIGGEFNQKTFATEEHGLEYPLFDRDRAKYKSMFDSEAIATRILMFQMLLNHEYRVSTMYAAASMTSRNVTAWSTAASANPLKDINDGCKVLMDACGAAPADISVIIPRSDYTEMLVTDKVVEKIKYTYGANNGIQPYEIQPAAVASMLEVKEVLVANSVYDSTEEGVAESNTQIWTPGSIYLAVLAGDGAALDTPSAFRTILWDGYVGDFPLIESYRDDKLRGDVIRAIMDTDEVQTGDSDLFVVRITNP